MYLGMTGLIHVPSAEMNEAGDARIGVHYIPNEMLSSRLWEYYGKGKLFDSVQLLFQHNSVQVDGGYIRVYSSKDTVG